MTDSMGKKREADRLYYQKTKDRRKNEKARFDFKIEVKSVESERINTIKERIARAKQGLGLLRSSSANADLLEKLLDSFEQNQQHSLPRGSTQLPAPFSSQQTTSPDISMEDVSMETIQAEFPQKTQLHSPSEENDPLFLVTKASLHRLFSHFIESGVLCKCGNVFEADTLVIERVTKNNHCCKVLVKCSDQHILEWYSSPILNGKYYANLR